LYRPECDANLTVIIAVTIPAYPGESARRETIEKNFDFSPRRTLKQSNADPALF
jgi:hypothetical protein